jgi:hypothetical protein
MLEVADIFRLHSAAYQVRVGHPLPSPQRRAMRDIQACRTAYFGGHLKQCHHCGQKVYAYHSCRNRHCPKCHADQTARWLQQQQERLLPCPYYLLTFTLPKELRALALRHPRKVYSLLMRCAVAALQKLAADGRYVGGSLGCLAVLHTWTRALLYHPHVHLLVTAGGLSADGAEWMKPKNPAFLVPVRALSVLFRAQLCAALQKAGLLDQIPSPVWKKNWVVHCQPAGSGQKVLHYLARYVFRIALTNSRLEQIDDSQVTFRYRDNRTQQMRRITLPGVEFIGRFLLHVLPQGCAKVRHYGICSSSCRQKLNQARALLSAPLPAPANDAFPDASPTQQLAPAPPSERCPHCRIGQLVVIEILPPSWTLPP